MKKLYLAVSVFIVLIAAGIFNMAEASDAHTKNICSIKDKDLKCSDLNYFLDQDARDTYLDANSTGVCSSCPLDYHLWACTKRGDATTIAITTVTDDFPATGAPVCANFPSCEQLGYYFSAAQVEKVAKEYSCSACPLDGRKWACAGPEGLVKPNS